MIKFGRMLFSVDRAIKRTKFVAPSFPGGVALWQQHDFRNLDKELRGGRSSEGERMNDHGRPRTPATAMMAECVSS
jgi:hypothetical protein